MVPKIRSTVLLAATVAAGLAAVCSSTAHASLLVYEGFDVPGASTGQTWSTTVGAGSTSVGFAPSSTWQGVTSSGAYPTTAADYTFGSNLGVSGLASSGGAIQMNAGSGAYYVTQFSRQLGESLPSTIWGSFVVNLTTDSGSTGGVNNVVSLSFTNSPTDLAFQANLGVQAQGYDNGNLGGLFVSGAGLISNSGTAATFGSTSKYVVLYDLSGLGTGGIVRGNEWILTSSQYATLASSAGGVTDTALNSAALGNSNQDVLQRIFNSDSGYLISSAPAVASTDYLQLESYAATTTFDEIRIGTTLADVAPVSVVPEPSSFATLGLGAMGIGLLVFRRRKADAARGV